MLLCHLTLLVLSLHHAAVLTEVLHGAVEDGILAELALQRSVINRNLDGWLQTDGLEAFLAVAQHPSLVAHESMLQTLANHLICIEEVRRRDALSVRRIGHHDALVGRLLEVLEVSMLHGDVLCETCCTNVKTGCVNGLHVHVVAIDMVCELALLRVIVINLVEEFLVEVGPLLEGEALAEDARAHVMGDESSLDEQRSRTTHRVDEVAVAVPSGHHNHTCCQHLVERSLHRLLTVAATMERLAT